jgi:hypothetical protein
MASTASSIFNLTRSLDYKTLTRPEPIAIKSAAHGSASPLPMNPGKLSMNTALRIQMLQTKMVTAPQSCGIGGMFAFDADLISSEEGKVL